MACPVLACRKKQSPVSSFRILYFLVENQRLVLSSLKATACPVLSNRILSKRKSDSLSGRRKRELKTTPGMADKTSELLTKQRNV